MNSFTPRVPNFVDRACFTEEYLAPFEFNTFEELLGTQFIKDKMAWPDFVKFSKSDEFLVAEAETSFWVIGYLRFPDDVDLPILDMLKFEKSS